jgi:hypothetical protein
MIIYNHFFIGTIIYFLSFNYYGRLIRFLNNYRLKKIKIKRVNYFKLVLCKEEMNMNKRKNKMNLTGNSFITNHRSTKLDAE